MMSRDIWRLQIINSFDVISSLGSACTGTTFRLTVHDDQLMLESSNGGGYQELISVDKAIKLRKHMTNPLHTRRQ